MVKKSEFVEKTGIRKRLGSAVNVTLSVKRVEL
jgi:hypothetical protein